MPSFFKNYKMFDIFGWSLKNSELMVRCRFSISVVIYSNAEKPVTPYTELWSCSGVSYSFFRIFFSELFLRWFVLLSLDIFFRISEKSVESVKIILWSENESKSLYIWFSSAGNFSMEAADLIKLFDKEGFGNVFKIFSLLTSSRFWKLPSNLFLVFLKLRSWTFCVNIFSLLRSFFYFYNIFCVNIHKAQFQVMWFYRVSWVFTGLYS